MVKPVIFVFSTAYEPFIGGAEVAIAEVAKRLKASYTFFVITARFDSDLAKEETKNNVTVIRVGWGSRWDKFLLPLLGPFIVRRLQKKYSPVAFWAVMASFASGIPYILNLVRPWKKIPIVLTLQEGDPESHLERGRGGLIGLSWRAALSSFGAPAAVTAISAYLGELAKSFGYQGSVDVIPNGVDISTFSRDISEEERRKIRHELGLLSEEKIVIHTGRLVHKNGLDTLISAISLLPDEIRKNIKVLLVGTGHDEAKLKSLASKLDLREQILFLGHKLYHTLPRYLAISDVFIRPSRSEGMGNSFIEAMAAGIPIIGTAVGGIVDFLHDRETGFVARREDPASIARAITEIFSNVALRRNMVQEGKKIVEECYDWETIAAKYNNVFSRVIIQNQNPALLIASGIYPPDIGGSASYAYRLANFFKSQNWHVEIFAYGNTSAGEDEYRTTQKLPIGLRHLLAFILGLPLLWRADIIFLFDYFSIGWPVAAGALLWGKPYAVRIGGDYLWERYVESRRVSISIPEFYQTKWPLSLKERITQRCSAWVLRHASSLIFTTQWQRSIFVKAYGLDIKRTIVIENAADYFAVSQVSNKKKNVVVFAGRFLFLKNLKRALLVFRDFVLAKGRGFSLRVIGDGPEKERLEALVRSYNMTDFVCIEPPQEGHLLREILASSKAIFLPSLSDISPNIVLEALALGTPAILTQYTGYALSRSEGVISIDPLDNASIQDALSEIANPNKYAMLQEAAQNAKKKDGGGANSQEYKKVLLRLIS